MGFFYGVNIIICSIIGPNAKAGKKLSPPIISIQTSSITTKIGPVVGKVPEVGGRIFFFTREPATPITAAMLTNLPSSIHIDVVIFIKLVFALSPLKELPLLLEADINA